MRETIALPKATVTPTVPEAGTAAYVDVICVETPNGAACLPGTRYRAAAAGERPTHYPDVPNSLGSAGFLVDPRG